jgi:hypothetical protein
LEIENRMNINEVIAGINEEIARLERARDLLSGSAGAASSYREGSTPTKVKRILSPEARARIVAAQKARWAKVKKQKTAQS